MNPKLLKERTKTLAQRPDTVVMYHNFIRECRLKRVDPSASRRANDGRDERDGDGQVAASE